MENGGRGGVTPVRKPGRHHRDHVSEATSRMTDHADTMCRRYDGMRMALRLCGLTVRRIPDTPRLRGVL